MKPWQATIVTVVSLLLMALAVYGVYKYINRSIESEQPAEVVIATDTIVAVEEVIE